MLDSGFMPPCFMRLSDRKMHGGGCAVATREKTAVFLSTDENYCLHYVLFLMHLSVAHKAITSLLQLNTSEICWIAVSRWTLVIDVVGWWSIYLDVMPTMLEPMNYISS